MKKPNRGQRTAVAFPFTDATTAGLFEALFSQMKHHNPDFKRKVFNQIVPHCEIVEFEKNEIVLEKGETCRHVYFATEGIVTAIEPTNGRDRNCWFMGKGDIIIAIESFYKKKPSTETLLALEKTVCIALHVDDLEKLREKHNSFALVQISLTDYYYCEAYERTKWVEKEPAEVFALLMEKYPRFMELVTLHALASYLGCSVRTLSRIKKEYLSK